MDGAFLVPCGEGKLECSGDDHSHDDPPSLVPVMVAAIRWNGSRRSRRGNSCPT
jgi:hypothetical protein